MRIKKWVKCKYVFPIPTYSWILAKISESLKRKYSFAKVQFLALGWVSTNPEHLPLPRA